VDTCAYRIRSFNRDDRIGLGSQQEHQEGVEAHFAVTE
jgi:hypothetical protein